MPDGDENARAMGSSVRRVLLQLMFDEDTAGREEPVLDSREIQGNVLAGFNKDYQAFLFLRIVDVAAARAWIGRFARQVATLDEVIAFNRLYKIMRARRGKHSGALQAFWQNIAFSYSGLTRLAPDAHRFSDLAFKQGMHARATLLGDPPDSTDAWTIGSPETMPDVLVILAADSAEVLETRRRDVESSLAPGLQLFRTEHGKVLPDEGHEHFGFRDGISQPGVRGRVSTLPFDYLTPRENPVDRNEGKPGQTLLWPGEFVFGYPRQSADDIASPGPIAEGGPPWSKNGSFLVFRRYVQHVDRFREFLETTATALMRRGAQMRPETLGAKLMGRWKSGTPIVRAPAYDVPEIAASSCTDNHFRYAASSALIPQSTPSFCADQAFTPALADPEGMRCPHAAHIRKVNPRDTRLGSRSAETHTHRLIRRGIPFGTSRPGEEDGLLFVAYQTSFERQFEFVMSHWVNHPDFSHPGAGYDPIIGRTGSGAEMPRTFLLPLTRSDGTTVLATVNVPEIASPTGGAYFFAPSRSALEFFARGE